MPSVITTTNKKPSSEECKQLAEKARVTAENFQNLFMETGNWKALDLSQRAEEDMIFWKAAARHGIPGAEEIVRSRKGSPSVPWA